MSSHTSQPRLILASRPRLAWLILTMAAGLLSACGQRGPLYIPNTPAAAQRATLPQVLTGRGASAPAPAASAPEPAAPVPAELQAPTVPDTLN